MWQESAEKRQQSIFRNSFVWGLSNLPIHPSGAILFYAISAIFSSVSASGYIHGLIYLGIRLITLYGLLTLLSNLQKNRTNPEIWNSSLLVAMTVITFEGIGWTLNFAINMPISFAGSIFDFFWILYLLWFVGFVSAFLTKQEEMYVSLNSFISQSEVEAYAHIQESRKISREIAKYLHGTIQSQLMGSAFAIEKAGRAGNVLQLEKEIQKAYENLLASPQKYFNTNFDSLSDSIIDVTQNWNELMDVQVKNLLSNDSVSKFDTERIHNVLDDALSNSFRHGLSTQITIELLRIEDTKIQIIVSDNGRGMKKETKGLGAQSFTAIAGKNWKWVTNSLGGVDLILTFPSTFSRQG
jgi:signal transduction histidine kinase